jgi:beta-N-acetylhexosaminidase
VGAAADGLCTLSPSDHRGLSHAGEKVDAPIEPIGAQHRQRPPRPHKRTETYTPFAPGRGIAAPAVSLAVITLVLATGLFYFGSSHGKDLTADNHAAPSSAPGSAVTSPAPAVAPICAATTAALSRISVRDKLAQLITVGVTGADDARSIVSRQHVGGIFIGSWTDLSMLSNGSLTQISGQNDPLPLSVSVDEEGGRVERLAKLIGRQPSARALAQTRTAADVYSIANERGRKMHDLGITVDFAPVVDVTDAPDDTVIGDRSFSDDPTAVVQFAQAYAKGLRDARILPVLKHFPGHGHGSGDSHVAGQVVTPPLSKLETDDLIPYRALTTEMPVAVMLGHLEVPGLTNTEPASLSKPAYDLLRSGSYGGRPFNGMVFTDDLSSMAAINQRYGIGEAALRALQAGADTALWISTDAVSAVLDRLVAAYKSGELPHDRVDDAVHHVATAKHMNVCG